MFDSNCSFYGNRNSHSIQNDKLKKIKEFVKKPFKNIRYQLESANVSTYTHELKPCFLELNPSMSNSECSLKKGAKNKSRQSKQSSAGQEHRSRTASDKVHTKFRTGKRSKSSKKTKEATSSESILTGLTGVIDLCGLLDKYDDSNSKISITDYSKKHSKRPKEKPKIHPYKRKYDTMILSTSSPIKGGSRDDTFYETAIEDSTQDNSMYVTANSGMNASGASPQDGPNSPDESTAGSSSKDVKKEKTTSAILSKTGSKSTKESKSDDLRSIKHESEIGPIKQEPSRGWSMQQEPSSASAATNVTGSVKQEPSGQVTPEKVDKSIYSIGSQKSSGNYGTYVKSEKSDDKSYSKDVSSGKHSIETTGTRRSSIKNESLSSKHSSVRVTKEASQKWTPKDELIKEEPSQDDKPKIKEEDDESGGHDSESSPRPIKHEEKAKSEPSVCTSRETVTAHGTSKFEDKTMKWCDDDPCGIVECCGKLNGSKPCVRFQDSQGNDICYHYKCRAPLALSTKCFPPVEIPPCKESCKACVSVGTEIRLDDINSECKCSHSGDGDKYGGGKSTSSQRSVRSKHSTQLGGNVICNPDYVFPPGGRKKHKIERSKTAMPPIVQQVVGVCTDGKCGGTVGFGKPLSVKYAIVKISRFKDFCIYELTKAFEDKPKNIPVYINEIFVTKV